ncbi:MAG: helix-turn-helix domain-containing protein [Arhodomonas sp.]|nr:helix-turn-helix domain-containing protein [Arhodomonas sp.]
MAERPARTSGRPRTSNRGGGHSQSLTRGLNILEALAGAGHGLTLSEISQIAGLAPSTTHRLLHTLEQLQFVQQDEELGLWQVGVKAFIVGNGFVDARDYVAESRPCSPPAHGGDRRDGQPRRPGRRLRGLPRPGGVPGDDAHDRAPGQPRPAARLRRGQGIAREHDGPGGGTHPPAPGAAG